MAIQTVPGRHFEVCGGFFDEAGNEVLRYRELTPIQRQRARDLTRTACQAPISGEKRCVLYVVNGKEKSSPWFYRNETIQRAFAVLKAKYGERNCIIYWD